MTFDSSWSLRRCTLLLCGALAVTAGCSGSSDKETGTSGDGPRASAQPGGGDGAAGSPSQLSFGGGGTSSEPGGEPALVPPLTPPGGGDSAAGAPSVTLPPDVPLPSSSAPTKSTASSGPRQPGEPELTPPVKHE
jgi:hypothetical protein